MTDVSIIIISYNVADELRACLVSVAAHRGPLEVETIVVDNASTDGTAGIVERSFPDVRLIRLARNEKGVGRNHGLRVARGRYRMFLDSDAMLTAGALPELVDFMSRRPQVGLAGPRVTYPDGRPQPSARRFPPRMLPILRRPPLKRFLEDSRAVRHHLMLDEPMDHTREVEYVIGACQIFSADAQRAVGELDPRIAFAPEDIDWCLRMRKAGFEIAYHPAATVIHAYRRTTAQRPWSRMGLEHLYGFGYFQWKWRRERRALIDEGRRMDLGARRAREGSPATATT